jgi:hypothetical protein
MFIGQSGFGAGVAGLGCAGGFFSNRVDSSRLCPYMNDCTTSVALAVAGSKQYWMPFHVGRDVTIDTLGMHITTGSAGNTIFRLGIYDSSTDFVDEFPRNLLTDCIAGSTATTGYKKLSTTPVTLTAGELYWLSSTNTDAISVFGGTTAQVLPVIGQDKTTGVQYSALESAATGFALLQNPSTSFFLYSGSVPLIYIEEA